MIDQLLAENTAKAIVQLYGQQYQSAQVQVQKTLKDFEGDYTVVIFPFTKISRKSPEQTAAEIGAYLSENVPEISRFTVVKGFLNIVISQKYWCDFIQSQIVKENYGIQPPKKGDPWLVEFSSPNTNKPLHLGHIRNNLLGWSVSRLLQANGKKVVRVNLINDRGIHICKSMLAYQKWGKGKLPGSAGKKGDHYVGDFYILFDTYYKEEVSDLVQKGIREEQAVKIAPLIVEAQKMLQQWEAGDPETLNLWKRMNKWVYTGFDVTYKRLGVAFDKTYYESETYLLGKKIVEEGLARNSLVRKADGSVWADLRDEGLDEKILMRADGTSVYMTQDLGTANLRYREYYPEKMVYVVGNEQNYHFDVLKKVLKKLGFAWADSIHHLSYGMVELPEGKMKSREGTIVDADDLMDEMIATAKQMTTELGKAGDFTEEEAENLYRMIGLGALKYFILKVDPDKNMLFDPKESIDFDGNTGPFIQYTHARICSLLRKAGDIDFSKPVNSEPALLTEEREILKLCHDFPSVVREAGATLSPALVANYVYELTRNYNTFYQKIPVLKEENPDKVYFRLMLTAFTGRIIKLAMELLGIDVPERM